MALYLTFAKQEIDIIELVLIYLFIFVVVGVAVVFFRCSLNVRLSSLSLVEFFRISYCNDALSARTCFYSFFLATAMDVSL